MKPDFDMDKLEKKMLNDLYESVNGIYAFTFYSKYKIEPQAMFDFIRKNIDKGNLTFENDKLELTKDGKNIVLKQMFHKKTTNKYSNIPNEFIIEKIKINSPYLPNLKKVSAEILNIKGGKETSI